LRRLAKFPEDTSTLTWYPVRLKTATLGKALADCRLAVNGRIVNPNIALIAGYWTRGRWRHCRANDD